MKKSLYKLWRGLIAVFTCLVALAIGLSVVAIEWEPSINMYLGIETGFISGANGTVKYESKYGELNKENLDRLVSDIDKFVIEELEEGSVLLHNNGVLPLATGSSISLFGHASYDTAYKDHSAGADVEASRLINMYNAFTNAGFKVNKTLYDAYSKSTVKRENVAGTGSDIGEDPISFYNSSITSSYANYKDAAIVVFARIGGEGFDLNKSDKDGVPQLSLHQSEKALLDHIKANGFEKVIVLLNMGFAMEVHELYEHGVDACMWIGLPGITGCQGVANIIAGKVSPSGRTVDTYAKNSLSAPAMINFGDYHFSNKPDLNYVINAEGIYVGYKYYETRYEDVVLGNGNASNAKGSSTGSAWNYADEVVYSFGHGLGYTTFTQEIVPDTFKYDEDTDTYSFDVKVTNTGDKIKGKDVVEVYLQSPYTDYDKQHLVEKAAIQLVGYAKTDDIAPKENATVTVSVDRYLCASYDGNEAKGYILDAGDYYFSIGKDAHDALNNVLVAKGLTAEQEARMVGTGDAAKTLKWTVDTLDTTSYKKSAATEETVTNIYTGDYAVDINDFYDEDVVTYLSRQAWDETWPVSYANLQASAKLIAASNNKVYTKSSSAKKLSDWTFGVIPEGEQADILLYETADWEFDDPRWKDFIDQLPLEILVLAIDNNTGLKAINEIGKPRTRDADGPNGFTFPYLIDNKKVGNATLYAGQIVAGSSWNVEILRKLGDFYAEECLYAGGNEVFGPGLNLHRTPYSGRNFEYFSEDSIFTYLTAIPETSAMAAKGLIASPKHFCANDQEENRQGLCTFMTEQRLRQEPMKGFEGAITKGKSGGVMGMMGRIGAKASTACYPLMTLALRNEWGFTGSVITDAGGAENAYQPTADCLMAGTDMFCLTSRSSFLLNLLKSTDDGDLVEVLREINHRYYYTRSHSNLVNGLSKDTVVGNITPWWKPVMFVVDGLLGALLLASVGLFVWMGYFYKKKEKTV